MKRLSAKAGLLLTLVIVFAVATYGYMASKKSQQELTDECTEATQTSSSQGKTSICLKGVAHHLLDFYK
ncbi:MAG TPA: hypothetical protein PKD90_05555 [Phnomibacter sp.]|nr:hypothetical protein [Phnomibacter sp.]